MQQRGGLDVVEADHRQLARHVDAALLGGRQHAYGLRVGRGEDRGGRVRQGQQLAGQLRGHARAVRAQPDQGRVEPGAGVDQLLPVAVHPPLGRGVAELVLGPAGHHVADVADPAVAQAQQVAGGQPAAGHVVDAGLRHASRHRVHRHQRDRAAPERGQVLLGQVDRDHHHAVGPVPRGQRGQVVVALLRGVRVAHDRVVALLVQHAQRARQPGHRGRPGQVRDHDRHRARGATGQRRGQMAGPVTEPVDDLENVLPGGLADVQPAVQDPGNGAGADSG